MSLLSKVPLLNLLSHVLISQVNVKVRTFTLINADTCPDDESGQIISKVLTLMSMK